LLLTLLFIGQFCYIFTQVVAESVVTVLPPAGRCHAVCTHLPHPPPPIRRPCTATKGGVRGVPHSLVLSDRVCFNLEAYFIYCVCSWL